MRRRRAIAATVLTSAAAALLAAAPALAAPFQTTLVTVGSDDQAGWSAVGGAGVHTATISADGRWIAYASGYTNLAAGAFGNHVFRYDVERRATTIVSRADGGDGAVIDGAVVQRPGISRDGGRVLFLVPGDGAGGLQLFVRDVASGRTLLASRADGTDGLPAAGVEGGVLSADGRYVAFSASGDAVAPGVPPRSGLQIYLRDLRSGRTVLVSRGQGLLGPIHPGGERSTQSPTGISPGGRFVTFRWWEGALLDDVDRNGQIYLRDMRHGRTLLVSRADGPEGEPAIDSWSGDAPVTADGCIVAFGARGDHLVAGLRGELTQVFTRNLCTHRTLLVSRADGPAGEPAYSRYATPGWLGPTWSGSMSADGRYVAFHSHASNLVPGTTFDDKVSRSYLRDLVGGRTLLLSRADGAEGSPGHDGRPGGLSADTALSADGTRAVFPSTERGLALPDSPHGNQIYLRDSGPQPAGTPVDGTLDDPGTGPPNEPPPVGPGAPDPPPGDPGTSPPPAPLVTPPPPAGPVFVPPPAKLRISGLRVDGRQLRLRVSGAARVTLTVERRTVTRRGDRTTIAWRRVAGRTLRSRAAATLATRLPRLSAGRHRVLARAAGGNGRASATRAFTVRPR